MSRASSPFRVHPASPPKADEMRKGIIAAQDQKEKNIDTTGSDTNAPEQHQSKHSKRKSMLTSSQLSDLFTRLDRNGDGSLDLNEFIDLIRILKVDVSAEYAASVFKTIDQAAGISEATGTLNIQEFIAAYQKIYVANGNGGSGKGKAPQDSFVRATRYGRMLNGEYVFECYTIPSSGKGERYTLDLSAHLHESDEDSDEDEDDESRKDPEPLRKDPWDAVCEPWEGTLDDINIMIQQDSCRNKTLRSNVLWWIDAAYGSIDRATAEEIVTRFGLPNDSRFLFSFDNFGGSMPPDSKSRVYAGTGNHTLGTVYSLSYFAQAMWIDNIPVVHHLPPWVRERWSAYSEHAGSFSSRVMQFLIDYYKTHFAWLVGASWSDTAEDTKRDAYERAEGLAAVISSSDEDEKGWFAESSERPSTGGGTIFTSKGQSVPLTARSAVTEMPSWLKSVAQIRKNPPKVCMSSLSIHILDQGFGSHTLLTVREIDSENQKNFTQEQRSRAGVLGRMISGVWVKLAQVTVKGERAGAAGELAESPASLVTFLLMLVHNFSMNSMTSVDHWMNILEKEIEDIVVSKHSAHLAHAERILKDFSSYLDPLEGILMNLSAEQEEQLSLLHEQHANTQKISQPPLPAKGWAGNRRLLSQFDATAVAALPRDAEKLSLTYSLVNPFLGGEPYRELRTALDGYEMLELKGLNFWKERMRKFALRVADLKHLIQSQMDEKRNFATFMLTVLTTLLAPMTIFTGYFGMNFDNMTELSADPGEIFPGVAKMWAISGMSYGILFLLGIHFRILYSVT